MDNKAYEDRLADALEKVLEQGADDLEALSAALNAQGVRTRQGLAWTAASLEAEFARLGEAARDWERSR